MNSTAAAIQQQLDDGVIGIIGLGYVGLPLALRYAEVGYRVIGFDIDASKIAALNSGCSYISYIPDTAVEQARRGGFEAVCDYQRVAELSALIICVPTPLGKHLDPDLGFVRGTLDAVVPHMQAGQVIALESTTYPGTTEEEVVPRLRARGLEPGRDVFVVYSPEREDPGNPRYTTRAIPKVVGGYTPACLQAGLALYHRVIDQLVPVSSTRAAEMTKLLENIHRAVNIGLVNEMKLVAEKMGIDIFEVIDAAATKPFGFTPYYPGPGLGGHCIPIDPYYLTWKAREYGINTRFIELAGEVNRAMPRYTIQRLQEGLSAQSKALNGSRVLVLGIAYKKNVSDTRESPSIEMMDLLREKGADVAYSDPFVPIFPVKRDYAFDLCSEPLSAAKLAGFDAVLIGTDHDAFDYELIQSSAQLVVDTRGRYRSACANIIRA